MCHHRMKTGLRNISPQLCYTNANESQVTVSQTNDSHAVVISKTYVTVSQTNDSHAVVYSKTYVTVSQTNDSHVVVISKT